MLLSLIDEKVKNEAHETPYKNTVPIIIGKWMGEPIPTFSIAGGFYLYGIASGDKIAKRIGFEVAESFIYAGTINLILKVLNGDSTFIQKKEITILVLSNSGIMTIYPFLPKQ